MPNVPGHYLRKYGLSKKISFLKWFIFTDAPRAVYGQDSRQQDILSDGTGTITVYGLIGDQCLDDRDCFIDSTSCIEGMYILFLAHSQVL